MTMHDRALQGAYRAWMAKGDSSAHLDDAAWELLVESKPGGPEREALLAHVLACTECSEIWKSLLKLKREAEAEGLIAAEQPSVRSSWRGRIVPLALAATLILAATGLLLTRRPVTNVESVRGTLALSPIEGLMMAYSGEGVPTLVWTPVPEATRYRIEIFSEDGRPLSSKEVAAPPSPWPADLPRTKGTYRWRVEALGADGAVARSRLTLLEISR